MSQNRDAPAYQEYAASMMARLHYRTMTLPERGLLYTMRLECWVNSRLPRNPAALAKVLGFDAGEVAGSLAAVLPFFEVLNDYIISPELENYRAHLENQKERMSNGGKRSAEARNGKHKTAGNRASVDDASTLPSTLPSPLQAPRPGAGKVLVKSSTEKPSQNQPLERAVITDPFVDEYEAAEACSAADYAKASGG